MSTIHRVACHQLAPQIGQTALNLRRSLAAISSAARQGAKLVVLPELALSGYVFHDRAEAHESAEDRDGPNLAAWAEQSRQHDIIVVGGFCERLDNGQVANASVLIQPDGTRTYYRKVHLWDKEKWVFTPGSDAPPVIETAIGRVAMMICYDLEFPEWVRLASLAGAQLLCAPVNWPNSLRPSGQRLAEVIRVQANAAVNRLFLIACDRSGQERGVDWTGGSTIADLDGHLMAGGERDQGTPLLLADIELSRADDKRISDHNNVISDRRPALYHALSQPF